MGEEQIRYNIIFDTKGKTSKDSMPIGNGDIASNVWVEDNGDLVFYLAKGDAWSEATRLLKVGRVRLKIKYNDSQTNPFEKGKDFRQELRLDEGTIYITAGNYGEIVSIKIWVDANNPVMYLQVTAEKDIIVETKSEIWRYKEIEMTPTTSRSYIGVHINTKESPKESADIVANRDNKILWYHRNEYSMYREMVEYQKLDTKIKDYFIKYPDPYINNTFGALIKGSNMVQGNDTKTIVSKGAGKEFNFEVYLHKSQTETFEKWEEELNNIIVNIKSSSVKESFIKHTNWWKEFWNRSWIFVSGSSEAETITRGYLLQRYMIACQGRGEYPIKFNGGLFTMPDRLVGDDYRDWGSMYWHQNTRLVYWPLLSSGDFEMVIPYFDLYKNSLNLRKEISKEFFQVKGAYYPEQMYFYGADGTRDKVKLVIEGIEEYTTYHWQNGFEIVTMMLDYYEMTGDEKIVIDYIIPIGQELVRFYYEKYLENGKLNIYPSNALETYWNCTNPTDHIAGLKSIISRMLNLPSNLINEELIKEWKICFKSLPKIPIDEKRKCIKPAEKYGRTRNIENPELYTVFPYRIYGLGKTDLQIAVNTFNNRIFKSDGCWYQDGVQAAYLGITSSAKKNVLYGLTAKASDCKFIGYWAKGNDEVPDFDNGGQASIALQKMLLQFEGNEIRILPAWPKEWNVDFKLYANNNTIIRVVYENGEIIKLESNKVERLLDIIEPKDIEEKRSSY